METGSRIKSGRVSRPSKQLALTRTGNFDEGEVVKEIAESGRQMRFPKGLRQVEAAFEEEARKEK